MAAYASVSNIIILMIFTTLMISHSTVLANLPSLNTENRGTTRGGVCYRSSLHIQTSLNDLSFATIYNDWPKKPATG